MLGDTLDVANGRVRVPAAREPDAEASGGVAGCVVPATIDIVEPGQLALEARTPRSVGVVQVVRTGVPRIQILEGFLVIEPTDLTEADRLRTLTVVLAIAVVLRRIVADRVSGRARRCVGGEVTDRLRPGSSSTQR